MGNRGEVTLLTGTIVSILLLGTGEIEMTVVNAGTVVALIRSKIGRVE